MCDIILKLNGCFKISFIYWQKIFSAPQIVNCSEPTSPSQGKIGPRKVLFRSNSHGKYEQRFNPLGIIAKDEFASVLAKTGVFSGNC